MLRTRSGPVGAHMPKTLLVAALLALTVLPAGCGGSPASEDDDGRPRYASADARREAKRECVKDAYQSGRTGTVTCAGTETVFCGETGTYTINDDAGQYKVVCKNTAFVGLAWDSDRNHFFKRVRFAGRLVGVAVRPGRGTRLPKPPPPPAPAPPPPPVPVPPAPEPSVPAPLRYSTGNDHGYTGPRCYESGGYYFTPC